MGAERLERLAPPFDGSVDFRSAWAANGSDKLFRSCVAPREVDLDDYSSSQWKSEKYLQRSTMLSIV